MIIRTTYCSPSEEMASKREGCMLFLEAWREKTHAKVLEAEAIANAGGLYLSATERAEVERGIKDMSNFFYPPRIPGAHCPSRPYAGALCYCGIPHRGVCFFYVKGWKALLDKMDEDLAKAEHTTSCGCPSQCGCPRPLIRGEAEAYCKGVEHAAVWMRNGYFGSRCSSILG